MAVARASEVFSCRPTSGLARKQRAAEAGSLEAVAAAMQAHPQVAAVKEQGCEALDNMCFGTDAAGLRQHAAEAGALELVVEAMQAFPQVASVQEQGCAARHNMLLH